jgi:queuosine precursor transporter
MNFSLHDKKQNLFIFLCSIVLANAIIAEIIGVKIFSAETLMGINPAQIAMPGGSTFDLNLTAGSLNWPIVFITSDLINEYFGQRGVRKISYLTAGLIAYCFVMLYAATALPPAQFWIDVNKGTGNFDINYAFSNIFRQGLGIIIGSITAFLSSQLLDALIFHHLKVVSGRSKIWLRATGSTLVSQLIDSVVVIFVAFYVFGNWSLLQVFNVAIVGYIYKFTMAIVLTPLLYLAHNYIDKYLGKEDAELLIKQAVEK